MPFGFLQMALWVIPSFFKAKHRAGKAFFGEESFDSEFNVSGSPTPQKSNFPNSTFLYRSFIVLT